MPLSHRYRNDFGSLRVVAKRIDKKRKAAHQEDARLRDAIDREHRAGEAKAKRLRLKNPGALALSPKPPRSSKDDNSVQPVQVSTITCYYILIHDITCIK